MWLSIGNLSIKIVSVIEDEGKKPAYCTVVQCTVYREDIESHTYQEIVDWEVTVTFNY